METVRILVMGMMWEYARVNGFRLDDKYFLEYCEDTIIKCAHLAHNPAKAPLPGAQYSDWQAIVWAKVHEVMIKMVK